MWGLQFLMVIVVVDFGDDNADLSDDGTQNLSALVVAAVLTVVFLGIAAMDWTEDRRLQKQSSDEWHKMAQWFHDGVLNEEGYAAMRDAAEAAAKETSPAPTDQAAQNDDEQQTEATMENPMQDLE
eukprot:COSAG02_NODE_2290_length_9205_cov_21.549198_6_plen_126_part_00